MILTGPDAAAPLAALHGACFPLAERWDQAAMAELLAMPGCFAVTDGAGAEPSGLALARVAADEAELLTLGVRPVARRQGLARALLHRLGAEAARRGAGALFLEVAVANPSALALYRAVGFAEVGRRRRYYPDGGDALILARRLDRPVSTV